MWAAYKGYPACVELFLRWGASVNVSDEDGFTALHWALVKGSPACIQMLLEYGSDRFAKTATGNTPDLVARDIGSVSAWGRALADSGFNPDATPKHFPLPYSSFVKTRGFLNRFFFLFPAALLFLVFFILSKMVVFAAVPISLFCALCLQWAAQQILSWAPSDMKHIHLTVGLAKQLCSSTKN